MLWKCLHGYNHCSGSLFKQKAVHTLQFVTFELVAAAAARSLRLQQFLIFPTFSSNRRHFKQLDLRLLLSVTLVARPLSLQ